MVLPLTIFLNCAARYLPYHLPNITECVSFYSSRSSTVLAATVVTTVSSSDDLHWYIFWYLCPMSRRGSPPHWARVVLTIKRIEQMWM